MAFTNDKNQSSPEPQPVPMSTGNDTHPNAYIGDLRDAVAEARAALDKVAAKADALDVRLQG